MCDWITEKSEKLEMDHLTTVKVLQRKPKGIKRELAPINDKVGQESFHYEDSKKPVIKKDHLVFCVSQESLLFLNSKLFFV